MNRRIFLAVAGAPWLAAAPLRLTRVEGGIESIDPAGQKATVLIFLSTICPISNAYQDRIKALITSFQQKPVRFVLVNSNDNETAAETAAYAADVKFPVPVYKDWKNAMADRFQATLTPETVVLDASGDVRYHGAIDDARNPARVTVEAVRLVVEALLNGQPVTMQPIRAFGCAIKKVRKSS